MKKLVVVVVVVVVVLGKKRGRLFHEEFSLGGVFNFFVGMYKKKK